MERTLHKQTGLGLLVVLLVTGVGVRILLRRDDAALCGDHLKTIARAVMAYESRFGPLADDERWADRLLATGLVKDRDLRCPADERARTTSYVLLRRFTPEAAGSAALLREWRANHGGGANVIYIDGHVDCVRPRSWQSQRSALAGVSVWLGILAFVISLARPQ